MTRSIEEIREFLESEIKDLTKEKALEELKERRFIIDMRDRWDDEDKKWYDVISAMIEEIEGGAK